MAVVRFMVGTSTIKLSAQCSDAKFQAFRALSPGDMEHVFSSRELSAAQERIFSRRLSKKPLNSNAVVGKESRFGGLLMVGSQALREFISCRSIRHKNYRRRIPLVVHELDIKAGASGVYSRTIWSERDFTNLKERFQDQSFLRCETFSSWRNV